MEAICHARLLLLKEAFISSSWKIILLQAFLESLVLSDTQHSSMVMEASRLNWRETRANLTKRTSDRNQNGGHAKAEEATPVLPKADTALSGGVRIAALYVGLVSCSFD